MNLGDAISFSGDPIGAKPYYARAVAIMETASPGNPEFARFLDRLAFVTLKENDLKEARKLYERSLALRQKALGQKHPEVAESLGGLADCASQSGRFQEAEALYKRALAMKCSRVSRPCCGPPIGRPGQPRWNQSSVPWKKCASALAWRIRNPFFLPARPLEKVFDLALMLPGASAGHYPSFL